MRMSTSLLALCCQSAPEPTCGTPISSQIATPLSPLHPKLPHVPNSRKRALSDYTWMLPRGHGELLIPIERTPIFLKTMRIRSSVWHLANFSDAGERSGKVAK
jgi:hypothetical protein